MPVALGVTGRRAEAGGSAVTAEAGGTGVRRVGVAARLPTGRESLRKRIAFRGGNRQPQVPVMAWRCTVGTPTAVKVVPGKALGIGKEGESSFDARRGQPRHMCDSMASAGERATARWQVHLPLQTVCRQWVAARNSGAVSHVGVIRTPRARRRPAQSRISSRAVSAR